MFHAISGIIRAEDEDKKEKACRSKFCFPHALTTEFHTIPLYNVATFRFIFFKVYTLGLYVKSDFITKEAINDKAPMALVMYFERDISKERLIDGAFDTLDDNPTVNVSEYVTELQLLNSHYKDVSEGETITFVHHPSDGFSLYAQNRKIVTIPNVKFSKDYFGIWLSEYPVNSSFKNKLFDKEK